MGGLNTDYSDITSRIDSAPLWWDESAVPRYCEFSPMECRVYPNEVVLALITCQNCGTEFKVAFSLSLMGRYIRGSEPPEFYPTLAERIESKSLHYGDPPNSDCCAAGPTMNSEPRRVLEYWARGKTSRISPDDFNYTRDPSLEIDITQDWARPLA